MKQEDESDLRKKYRKFLPYGAQKEIAKEIGVSNISVCLFLKGKFNSKRIEDAIINKITVINREREDKLKKSGLI